jgi:hypothetical protein
MTYLHGAVEEIGTGTRSSGSGTEWEAQQNNVENTAKRR